MDRSIQDELIAVATEWARAMAENDADTIGRYMADDRTVIGPDGRVGEPHLSRPAPADGA